MTILDSAASQIAVTFIAILLLMRIIRNTICNSKASIISGRRLSARFISKLPMQTR